MWYCNVRKRNGDSCIYIRCCTSLDICRNGAHIKADVNPEIFKSSSSVYPISTLGMACSNALAEDTLLTAADNVCCSRVTSSVFTIK